MFCSSWRSLVTIDPAVWQRLEVMALRIKLEQLSARQYDQACDVPSSQRGQQRAIAIRLLFLLNGRGLEALSSYQLITLGRSVYAGSSNVLHARATGLQIPAAIVAEWKATVERLVLLEASGGPAP